VTEKIDDVAGLFDAEKKEVRVRPRGKRRVFSETTDGRPKKPCALCGERTRRRGLDGQPRCADHAFGGEAAPRTK